MANESQTTAWRWRGYHWMLAAAVVVSLHDVPAGLCVILGWTIGVMETNNA